jgi:hypothetical protein
MPLWQNGIVNTYCLRVKRSSGSARRMPGRDPDIGLADYDAMLADDSIEVIYVATPSGSIWKWGRKPPLANMSLSSSPWRRSGNAVSVWRCKGWRDQAYYDRSG